MATGQACSSLPLTAEVLTGLAGTSIHLWLVETRGQMDALEREQVNGAERGR